MTREDIAEEFVAIAHEHAPDLLLRPYQQRGAVEALTAVYQAMVFVGTVGTFIQMVSACRAFLVRRPEYEVCLRYIGADGNAREARFTQLTIEEMNKLLETHAPEGASGLHILVRKAAT